jgi:hypothetical protein
MRLTNESFSYGVFMKLKIANAFNLATKAHKQQTRKYDGASYTMHLIEVYNILEYANVNDETLIIAGILHDTLEDTSLTAIDIEVEFGKEVLSIILSLTDDKALSYDARKAIALEKVKTLTAPALTIKIADVISNMSAIPPNWDAHKLANYMKYCLAVLNAAKQNPNFGSISPNLITLADYFHRAQTEGCAEYSGLCDLAERGLLYWDADDLSFVVANYAKGTNEAHKLSDNFFQVPFELGLLRGIKLSDALPRSLAIGWEQTSDSDEPLIYGRSFEVDCQQIVLETTPVNLQLNLNQFRVNFALNIDPAKNWPSTDSFDQESNFMVHLFNEYLVHLTVQIYTRY